MGSWGVRRGGNHVERSCLTSQSSLQPLNVGDDFFRLVLRGSSFSPTRLIHSPAPKRGAYLRSTGNNCMNRGFRVARVDDVFPAWEPTKLVGRGSPEWEREDPLTGKCRRQVLINPWRLNPTQRAGQQSARMSMVLSPQVAGSGEVNDIWRVLREAGLTGRQEQGVNRLQFIYPPPPCARARVLELHAVVSQLWVLVTEFTSSARPFVLLIAEPFLQPPLHS